MPETLLLKDGIVITMDPKKRVFERGAVAIRGDRIVAVGETDRITKEYKPDVEIDARGKLIFPGLIDLHFHTAIARGVADGLPLHKYLDTFWYPKLRGLKPEEAYAAALLSYGEAIKSGTTCVNDMYRHMISCSEAAERIGIRAVLSCDAADESEGLDTLKDNEELVRRKDKAANGRIRTWFGVEWVPISSKEFLLKTRELADKYQVGIHIHLNESLPELEMSKKRHGKRPLELAYDLNILGRDCVAAHCVWLTEMEIRMLKESETSVSHNPGSNSKLGNGISPAPELINAGINVGLGHDDAECNNTVDMFEAVKLASIIHRAHRADASLMPAVRVLEMATVNGARALGMEKELGSIEPGKKADLITVNLRNLRLTPLVLGRHFNLYSHMVYAAHGDDVNTVIIDGKVVMDNRKLINVDEDEIIEIATKACYSILERLS